MILLQYTMGREAGPAMIDPGANERYAFGPNVLLVLSIVPIAAMTWPSVRRNWARVLLCLAFISGLYDFVMFPIGMTDLWRGEPWRQQVLRQQHDPSVVLHGFPVNWSLSLDETPPP
jgi:hypothetical protein